MRGMRWLGFECFGHERFDFGVGNGAWSARPGFIDEAFQALRQKPLTPFADGLRSDLQLRGDHLVLALLSARENNARAQRQALG